MTQSQIKDYIKEAHDNAVEKGFYIPGEDKNIGELLMLIVSELGEALEAHRKGNFTPTQKQWSDIFVSTYPLEDIELGIKNGNFHASIKDTFEDEIADVFIRLFDLCGYCSIYIANDICEIKQSMKDYMEHKTNIGEILLEVTKEVCSKEIITSIKMLIHICDKLNIPVEKHITAKMAYNRTRPHKHGKAY